MILDVVVSVFYGKGEIAIKDNPDNLINEIVGIVKDKKYLLEFRGLWCTRERYYVTYILHASHEKNETLETETKASMRT